MEVILDLRPFIQWLLKVMVALNELIYDQCLKLHPSPWMTRCVWSGCWVKLGLCFMWRKRRRSKKQPQSQGAPKSPFCAMLLRQARAGLCAVGVEGRQPQNHSAPKSNLPGKLQGFNSSTRQESVWNSELTFCRYNMCKEVECSAASLAYCLWWVFWITPTSKHT